MNGLARLVMGVAAWLVPPDRREWLAAMRAESAYLPARESLRWALGCLLVATKERFAPMKTGDFRISRWVMLIETFGCFGFLACACMTSTFFLWNLSRLDWEIISKLFLSDPGETFMFMMIVLGAVVGLVGVVGLFLGLRFVTFGRALASRALGYTLLAVLLAYAVAVTAGYFVGPPDFDTNLFMMWGVVLPLAGVAHLMHLGRPASPGRTPALA